MTNFLLNPNVAYVLLMGGIIMGVLSVYTPGTGLIEVGALFAIVLAVYGFYNLPLNLWAFVLLILGIAPFILPLFWKKALKRNQDIAIVLFSFLALLAGSYFLVQARAGEAGMNFLVILVISAFSAGVSWLISHKGIEAIRRRPAHDLDRLSGSIGTATTDIFNEGSVYAGGEQWSARSAQPIPARSQVRILQRDGFTLEVEPLEKE